PMDDKAPLEKGVSRSLWATPPHPLRRRPISQPFVTGIRAIDTLMTLGKGQRVGLFAGSGVGKSTLMGMIARKAQADVIVVCLVGERGREVQEFISDSLGPEGLAKSVLVVSTSDSPALVRAKAPATATAIAEHYRDQGLDVLLFIDSLTRFARAEREIALSLGEPPARRGFPPSVFARLPALLERAGNGEKGSITAIYTVLVEGGDMEEPVTDEVRGIVDGHIMLSRTLASLGHFPAIDIPGSVSRVMGKVTTPEHNNRAREVKGLISALEKSRDLLRVGAYEPGGDPQLDRAVTLMNDLNAFLCQSGSDSPSFDENLERLYSLK
ncbi:FliI/YscN family ATPase, partial [Myxococcota bacterium]|nr:FliI/YscN family ATPase [Myxococcota bacterium]MBU1536263.1 FliI/YscN family ATPase [Myxococcota bacterium]